MKNLTALGNVQLNEEEDYILVTINPKIYPLELVYSAAYILLDKAYIILDGDPEKEIKVEIRKKQECQDLKTLAREFNEELLNYAVYKQQSEKNKGIRELLLQRVLFTNHPDYFTDESDNPDLKEEIEDPKGIMQPWREENEEPDDKSKQDNC